LTKSRFWIIILISNYLNSRDLLPTHYQGKPSEVHALDAFIKLTRAVNSLTVRLVQGGTRGDLTPTQFGVLESLYHLGTMCPGEISTKLLTSGGNLTLVIDNLEKRGLVRRDRSEEDRRMIRVSLTDKGHQLIHELLPGHVAAITEQMSLLTPEEQRILGDLCLKLGKKTD
jgi:MarR family 2-MHQ and catechol resistance regulon transcriptional repressor